MYIVSAKSQGLFIGFYGIMLFMPSDAHAHPRALMDLFPLAEQSRRTLGISCAASAWNMADFRFQQELSRSCLAQGGPVMALCFGVHPQLPREAIEAVEDSWTALESLVASKSLAAIGEAGFDLYDASYRITEAYQDDLFLRQLNLAAESALPMVLHVRKGMHKLFTHSRLLARLRAVVFHSYSGTYREASDLLKRGINGYFSFGLSIALNHKRAMEACALLPAERLVFETDAPYQAPRGKAYSSWEDVFQVIKAAAALRTLAGTGAAEILELTNLSDKNFMEIFCP